jgi:hypothetical protein
MKKLIFLLFVGIFSLSSAIRAGVPDYIVTKDEVKFYSKVRTGLSYLVGIDESGKDRHHLSEVLTYCKNGRIYERMPLIENNSETGKYAFMELISYRNGLKLYRHNLSQGTGSIIENDYLVYKNGNFVVRFDAKNYQTLNEFFFRPNGSTYANR